MSEVPRDVSKSHSRVYVSEGKRRDIRKENGDHFCSNLLPISREIFEPTTDTGPRSRPFRLFSSSLTDKMKFTAGVT